MSSWRPVLVVAVAALTCDAAFVVVLILAGRRQNARALAMAAIPGEVRQDEAVCG